MGSYRPMSVLPIISKIFEKEIFQQLYKHMNENNLISKFQFGFQPGYSTFSALIHMCDTQYNNLDNSELTGVVLLDIQKAFNLLRSLANGIKMVSVILDESMSTA